jgi:hypothetical protein
MPPIRSLGMLTQDLQRNYRRTDKDAFRTHVPHIDAELDEVLNVLNELEVQLPAIRTQTAHLGRLYDASRDKVTYPSPTYYPSTRVLERC